VKAGIIRAGGDLLGSRRRERGEVVNQARKAKNCGDDHGGEEVWSLCQPWLLPPTAAAAVLVLLLLS